MLDGLRWSLRVEVVAPLTIAGGLYAVGCWRLSRRSGMRIAAPRVALAFGGLACVALALLPPLDAVADRLFVAHMVQHMLLIMVAAPALVLADPYPIVLWGLPRAVRVRAGPWLTRTSRFGRAGKAATAMPLTWLAYASLLWFWHLPRLYEAALADPLVHDVEHVTLFVGAVLFWWPVIHPAPRFRRPAPYALRIAYLVLGTFQTAALGLVLSLAPSVLYPTYAITAPAEGLSALEDQMWGGIVMWAVGGLIDMVAVLVLLHRSLSLGAVHDDAERLTEKF